MWAACGGGRLTTTPTSSRPLGQRGACGGRRRAGPVTWRELGLNAATYDSGYQRLDSARKFSVRGYLERYASKEGTWIVETRCQHQV